MKIITYLWIVLLFLLTNHLKGQNLEELKNYNWESNPNYFEYGNSEEELIGVKDKEIIDFEYDDEGNLIEYHLVHTAYILNSDEAIEDYNKLYLPYTSASRELKTIKARVIKKNGEILELDESKILTSKDEETQVERKYYAFEGIEKGGIIEYYYLLKKTPLYTGKKVTQQYDYENNNYEFDLYCPINLRFKIKSYNELPDIIIDTSVTDKNHWKLTIKKVDKLEREDQAAYNARKLFFIYKLDKNTATNKNDLTAYSDIAQNIYSLYYSEKTKGEIKSIKKLINETNCNIARNKDGKIRAIENYIKSSFYLVPQNREFSEISEVIVRKTASYTGIIKLYTAIFTELEIDHQIVLTSDRFNLKFDKGFEAYNFLTDYLIYFPAIKAYMSPTDVMSRLGYPPVELVNNYGLFIKEINVNNIKTSLAKKKFIGSTDYKKNFDEMLVNIDLKKEDVEQSIVKFERSTSGYYAMGIQPFMNLFKDEDKTEIVDEYIKYLSEDIVILNKTVLNDDSKYFGVEPFKVISEFHLDPFIEKAGNKIILKVGNLIGPQMEMYQEKERILPVEMAFKRDYHRVITINLPEDLKIKNINDLNIYNDYVEDGETLMSFKSSYTLENNTLVITVDEFYDVIEIAPNLYNTYRKIINSAADFNKVSLVLE